MATKQRRRKHSRKEQSNKDKARTLMSDTTYAEPLREYNSFLDHLKSHGYARDEFTRIPLNLIDLAAAVIASMITGRELSLFGGHMYQDRMDAETQDRNCGRDHHPQTDAEPSFLGDEGDIFYLIQRILKRTQLSCTTLVLALIYIDRFKARLARTLKRRTRLDQGPDYDYLSNLDRPSFAELSRNDMDSSHGSAASSCPSSTSQSPASNAFSLTHRRTGSSTNSTHNSSGQEPWSSVSLFLVAVICADKYLFDATFSNGEWADFTRGQYTTLMLNDLERRFLGQLQYKLYVSEPEFDGFLSYLEVILALKQVWGRGLVTFSYSDVRILTQQLMPAYADRLHFMTLQGDMMTIVWQVVTTLSRVYLAVVGAIVLAAAGYTTMTELSRMASDSATSSSTGQTLERTHGAPVLLPSIEAMAMQRLSCAGEGGATATTLDRTEQGFGDEDLHHSVLNWALSRSAVVQCVV